jgi:hypothetical protein
LNAALKKYPQRLIAANLKSIYVLHTLEYSGISASGTNSRGQVYLANRGSGEGFTDCWVERTFHAEFSSILLRNFPRHLDKARWEAVNGMAFKYGLSGVQAVREGKTRKSFDASLHPQGFLYQYAKSSLENDFNSIAEQLFLGDGRFWAVVTTHLRLRNKTDLAVEFYKRTDAAFNGPFFKSVRTNCG